jgi:methyltransferase family protein
VKDIQPRSALDAGCAMGFLVEALRDRGVDAFGFDLSEYAIERVREDVRPYCWVGSVGDPLPRDYDLIICLEVLEHVEPAVADRAIDEFCAHTGDVVFSSTPGDFQEPTHTNVRPLERWAEAFAQRGLFRDVDADLYYVGDHAVRFRRRTDPLHRIVADYERGFWRLRQDASGARRAAMEREAELNRIPELEDRVAELERERDALREEISELTSSKAFQLARRVGSAARAAAPRGSRRGAIYDGLLHRSGEE